MRQSLLEKAVARSALLLQAENWGFLFLCKLQSCFCHLPTASCQPLWEGQSRAGVRMEQLLLFSSFLPGEHFVPSAVKAPLCRQVSIPRAEEAETSSRHLASEFPSLPYPYALFSRILFRSCLLSLKCSKFFSPHSFQLQLGYRRETEKRKHRAGKEVAANRLNIRRSIASLLRA